MAEDRLSDLADLGDALRRWLTGPRPSPDPLAVFDGIEVPPQAFDPLLSQQQLNLLEKSRILKFDGHGLQSAFSVKIVDGLVVFADPIVHDWRELPLYVDPLWEAPHLIRLIIPGRDITALDMGCGCGVISLYLTSFAEEVLGVDLNPRAVALARFNAAVNGVDNARFAESDLFAEARGRQFDRIVFNSPTGEESERRGLLEAGEQILERFFSEVSRHLNVAGYCQSNLGMYDYSDSRFLDRLRGWLGDEAFEFQILLLLLRTKRPRWRRRLAARLRPGSIRRVECWSRGFVTLRRGAATTASVPCNYRGFPLGTPDSFGPSLIRGLLDNPELLQVSGAHGGRARRGGRPADRPQEVREQRARWISELLESVEPATQDAVSRIVDSCLSEGSVEVVAPESLS